MALNPKKPEILSKLKESEEKYKAIFDNSPDPFYIHDLEGNFIDGNEAAIKFFGYKKEELVGKNFAKTGLLPKSELIKALANLALLADGKKLAPVEYKINKKDGTQVIVEIALQLITINGKKLIFGIVRDLSERQKTDQKIKHLASFPDLNPNPVIEYDLNGMLIYANIAAAEAIEAVSGKGSIDMYLPPDFKTIIKDAKTGKINIFRREIKIGDRIFSEDVNIDKDVGIVRVYAKDITELKEKGEELSINKEYLLQALNGVTVPIFAMDKNHIITHWNKACEVITGVLANEIVGKKDAWWAFYKKPRPLLADIIIDGTSKEALEAYFKGIINPSKEMPDAWEGEKYLDELRTGPKWLYFTCVPMKNAKGEIEAAIETFQDMTARHKAEDDLKKTSDWLEKIISHSNEMYYMHNGDGVITYVSQQCKSIFGFEPEEMKTLWTSLLTDNPMNEEAIKATDKALATGKRQPVYLVEFRSKDNKRIILEVDESPLLDNKGKVVGIAGAVRDMTEKYHAEEALKKQVANLEKMNKLTVGRELKMIELKKRIKELEQKAKI